MAGVAQTAIALKATDLWELRGIFILKQKMTLDTDVMSIPLDMGYEFYHGIWDMQTAVDEHCFDLSLAEYITAVFAPPASTLDLGCGKAEYLAAFCAAQWRDLQGIDGTVGLTEVAKYTNIQLHDLCLPLDLKRKYDLVISLEVGEHLPPQYESVFIENITQHAEKDILLSWAVDGQIGPGHVNCRGNQYIINQLSLHGFQYNERVSTGLRQNSSLPWFKNTLMYFNKAR